jgi:hypothetical protein
MTPPARTRGECSCDMRSNMALLGARDVMIWDPPLAQNRLRKPALLPIHLILISVHSIRAESVLRWHDGHTISSSIIAMEL